MEEKLAKITALSHELGNTTFYIEGYPIEIFIDKNGFLKGKPMTETGKTILENLKECE